MFLIKKSSLLELYKKSYDQEFSLTETSVEERSFLRKIDLFTQGKPSFDKFFSQLTLYKETPFISELIESKEFALLLKGVVSFWTFDDEEPVYPEQGFLSPDRMLAFEVHPSYEEDFKYFIDKFYEDKGVEYAYTSLAKILFDEYTSLEEEVYQENSKDLAADGIPSYEDSLSLKASLRTMSYIDSFIKKKLTSSHENSLDKNVVNELTQERETFLKINLYEGFHKFLVLEGNFINIDVLEKLYLEKIQEGLEYAKKSIGIPLMYLNFQDLFLIGYSLEKIYEKNYDPFLGEVYESFRKSGINYTSLIEEVKTTFSNNSLLYYNQNINFDQIFLTMFFSYLLEIPSKKIGLTLKDFTFLKENFLFQDNDKYYLKDKSSLVEKFLQDVHLDHPEYLLTLLDKEFEGQNFDNYSEDDLKYLGGVLLLKDGSR